MRELEEVVATLESGQVPLEHSLQLLQRAQELSTRCEKVLAEAQLTLEQLTLTPEGELTTELVEEGD